MRHVIAFLALSVLSASPESLAQSKMESSTQRASSSMKKQDSAFLAGMARSDMAEVAAGKLAVAKAKSDEVKNFGQHMVDEHSKMLAEGSQLAASKGITPPSAPDKKHQAAMTKLEGLSGDNFDRVFMNQMVADHRSALKLVKSAAAKASDSDLKALAAKAVPHVQEHLEKAQQLAKINSGRR